MKIGWMLLAEGIGQDAKAVITAIGLNQNVLTTVTLPSVTKRAIVVHVVDNTGTLKDGDRFTVTFNITSPHGKVIAAQTGQVTVGKVPYPDLPVSFDLPAELVFNVSEYGTYVIEATVQLSDGPEMSERVDFYVIDAPDPNAAESRVAPAWAVPVPE
jgi:hypothetical protein